MTPSIVTVCGKRRSTGAPARGWFGLVFAVVPVSIFIILGRTGYAGLGQQNSLEDLRIIGSTSPSPWYLDTRLPFNKSGRQDIGGDVVGLEVVDFHEPCQLFRVSEFNGSGPLVKRRIRTDVSMFVSASPAGAVSNQGFLPTWFGTGTFVGVQVENVKPFVTTVVLKKARTDQVLYSGPVTSGQIIEFSGTDVSWTGYTDKSHYGVEGSAFQVFDIFEVQEKEARVFFSGVPHSGQIIETPNTSSLSLTLVSPTGGLRYRLVHRKGEAGGGNTAQYLSLFGARNFPAMVQMPGDPLAFVQALIDGEGQRLLGPDPQWPRDGELYRDFVQLAQEYLQTNLSAGRADLTEPAVRLLRFCARARSVHREFLNFTPAWIGSVRNLAERLVPEFFSSSRRPS